MLRIADPATPAEERRRLEAEMPEIISASLSDVAIAGQGSSWMGRLMTGAGMVAGEYLVNAVTEPLPPGVGAATGALFGNLLDQLRSSAQRQGVRLLAKGYAATRLQRFLG